MEMTGNPCFCREFDEAAASGAMGQDPYPSYRILLERYPVAWSERWNCWLVSQYEDIVSIVKDTRRFSNRGRVVVGLKRDFPDAADGELSPLVSHFSQGLLHSDPLDHTRVRRLVQAAFLPRTIERLRPRIEAIVDELLDVAEERGGMEMVRDFSYPLPIRVIAEMLGIPVEMRDNLKAWSAGIIRFQANPCPDLDALRFSQEALIGLREYFRSVFRERRGRPGEDLISELVNVHLEGEKLTEEELLSTCVTLLIGGHETTTSLLTAGMWLLHAQPGIREKLRGNPELIPGFVEECLRYEPPFQKIFRLVTEDIPYHDATIPKGQAVTLLLGAGNRDGTVFADADNFNIERPHNRHLAFGAGPHFCLGAGVSRLEGTVAFRKILERFPKFRVPVERPIWNDGMVRTIAELPVEL